MNKKNKTAHLPRKSEAECRNEHLKEGAILIEFEKPKNTSNEALINWRKIEKKGFKITTDGCLISHKSHWFENRPTIVNYEASLSFFKGIKRDTSNDNVRNKYDWPMREQYSHLCHVNSCSFPDDIVMEPQWRNLKRNYCGFDDNCDCGNEVKCIRRYHNNNFEHKFKYLTYDTSKLKSKLKDLFGKEYVFKIISKDFYLKQDQKRENRNLRLDKKRKHDLQKKENAKKFKNE